ncbi:MAG: hypothetical protein WKF84_10900 [Pyrinomonadaceae bacterium]
MITAIETYNRTEGGIGSQIYAYSSTNQLAEVYGYLLIIGIIAVLEDGFFRLLKRVLFSLYAHCRASLKRARLYLCPNQKAMTPAVCRVRSSGKPETHGALLKLEHLSKEFPLNDGSTLVVLKDLSLSIDNIKDKPQIISLLGPSGSGKTTALRIIAGLDRAAKQRTGFDFARW